MLATGAYLTDWAHLVFILVGSGWIERVVKITNALPNELFCLLVCKDGIHC